MLLDTVSASRRRDVYDVDAQAYITAVEAADGQRLEDSVRVAIHNFVIGCKADASPATGVSNWAAMGKAFLMRGPRTIAGAFTPLKGSAGTNNGFTNSDYSRKRGPLSNGVKNFSTGTGGTDYATNNHHMATWLSDWSVSANLIRSGGIAYLITASGGAGTSTIQTRSRSLSRFDTSPAVTATGYNGFVGVSRTVSANYQSLANGSIATHTTTSSTPSAAGTLLWDSISSTFSLGFHSEGNAVTLTSLRTRLTDYMNAIAVLP
jgi:hypothetical protein